MSLPSAPGAPIFLIGFMGSGKTTVGGLLAERLGWSFADLDDLIVRSAGLTVAEIFARMPFVVRDLAREGCKKARLVMEGQQTEIDKYLIEIDALGGFWIEFFSQHTARV